MNPECVWVWVNFLVPSLLDLPSTRGWVMTILPPLCGPQQEYDHKKDVRYFNLTTVLASSSSSHSHASVPLWFCLSHSFGLFWARLCISVSCTPPCSSFWTVKYWWRVNDISGVLQRNDSAQPPGLSWLFFSLFSPHTHVSVMPPCFIYDRLWACFWHLTSVFLWRFFCFPGFIFSCMHTGVETAYPRKKNCPDVMPVCRCLMSLSACAPDFKSYFCCLQSSYRTNKSK